MGVKRINDFPDGSGTLSTDDIFLMMDDPAGNGTTKKVSLSDIANAIGIVSISGNFDTGDITFSGSTISTANMDQDIILDPNEGGNIVIGTNKNLILDINAFTAEGIKIIDSTEDGYDDPETPSVLKVGSIYHSFGNMVIQSDGAIYPSEDPNNEVLSYGGLVLTNKDNSAGFYIAPPTGAMFPGTPSGTIGVNGSLRFNNNTTLAQGTFDNDTGGNGGISLNCVVGYELNWQGGRLKSTYDNGQYVAPIYVDSPLSAPPVVLELSSYENAINTDASIADIFDVVLTENTSLVNPTNSINGKTVKWRIVQDGTGNRTISLGDKFNISNTFNPLVWSTNPNKMDMLEAVYHSGRDKWDIINFISGY